MQVCRLNDDSIFVFIFLNVYLRAKFFQVKVYICERNFSSIHQIFFRVNGKLKSVKS